MQKISTLSQVLKCPTRVYAAAVLVNNLVLIKLCSNRNIQRNNCCCLVVKPSEAPTGERSCRAWQQLIKPILYIGLPSLNHRIKSILGVCLLFLYTLEHIWFCFVIMPWMFCRYVKMWIWNLCETEKLNFCHSRWRIWMWMSKLRKCLS